MVHESQLEKSRTVEFAPIGIWKLDLGLSVLEANLSGAAQLQMPQHALIGRNFATLLPFVGPQIFDEVRHSLRTAKRQYRADLDHQRLHPTYWELNVGVRKEDEEVVGYIVSSMEVTEKERLLQQRDDFIAALSHNFKVPLLGADRTLDMLLDGALGELSGDQADVLQVLRRSNLQVLSIVQDLIEVYRYETNSANLKRECLDIGEVARNCIEELRRNHKSALAININLFPSAPSQKTTCAPRVPADRAAIKRLFTNLLETSLQYTSPGGTIDIDAESLGSSLRITIADNGIGLGVDDTELLFERFWQGVPGKTYAPTAGLGLYLSRKIVTAHGGAINVRTSSQGTTFSITLPTRV